MRCMCGDKCVRLAHIDSECHARMRVCACMHTWGWREYKALAVRKSAVASGSFERRSLQSPDASLVHRDVHWSRINELSTHSLQPLTYDYNN